MGDVIQDLDEIEVHRCDRHDGKKHTFELCIIYPEYMGKNNYIVKCKNENAMNEVYTAIIEGIHKTLHKNQKWICE
jgi:hypothetical protein